MSLALLLKLALVFATFSLLAVGGANAAAPEIRREVVERLHWMTSDQFAQTFAVSQAAPGPNVMLASLIGWRMAGLAGLAVATVAMIGPSSLLAWTVAQGWRRWRSHGWWLRLQAVLAPVAAGLIAGSGLALAHGGDRTGLAAAITAGAAAFVALTRRNPLWALAAAACLGVAARRLAPGLI